MNPIFTPRVGWLLVILWACSLLWVYQFAARNTNNAVQATRVVVMEKAIDHHNVLAAAGQKVEAKASLKQAKTEAHFEQLHTEVLTYAQTHPFATDCSIDADGLRIWRSANSNAETAGAGEPDPGLRGSATAKEWQDAGPPRQPRPSGEGVSPVQGEAPGAGGMGDDNP
jgi:hypothetical protein